MTNRVGGKYRHCTRCRIYHEAGGHVGCGFKQIQVTDEEDARLAKIIALVPAITRPLCLSENSYRRFCLPTREAPQVIEAPKPPGHRMAPEAIAERYRQAGRNYAGPCNV